MGGPRANYILFNGDDFYTINGKYSGSVIPETMVEGLQEYISWFDRILGRKLLWGESILKPYDATYTEGAVLVNTIGGVIIVGFDRWYSDFYPEAFDDFPEYYQVFHRHRNLRTVFLDLIQPVWPGWRVLFAEVESFGVEECIQPDPDRVRPVEAGPETDVPESEEQIRNTFIQILKMSLEHPPGQAALRRLGL